MTLLSMKCPIYDFVIYKMFIYSQPCSPDLNVLETLLYKRRNNITCII